jgi:hypothetical protein
MALADDLILLGATAALTGLLVPLIKGRMDQRRLGQERLAEEELRRDSAFIDLQNELLAELSAQLWEFAGLALAVSYYRIIGPTERWESAWEKYDVESFSALVRLRAAVSRSQRLVSAGTHQQLEEMFRRWFADLDPRLSALARNTDATDDQWEQHHFGTMSELFTRTDRALDGVASDVGVSRRQPAIAG